MSQYQQERSMLCWLVQILSPCGVFSKTNVFSAVIFLTLTTQTKGLSLQELSTQTVTLLFLLLKTKSKYSKSFSPNSSKSTNRQKRLWRKNLRKWGGGGSKRGREGVREKDGEVRESGRSERKLEVREREEWERGWRDRGLDISVRERVSDGEVWEGGR